MHKKFQLETLKNSLWWSGCKWEDNIKRQIIYKITLRHICLNTVAMEIQKRVTSILLSYICHCEQ
jgi:hypothetical protein